MIRISHLRSVLFLAIAAQCCFSRAEDPKSLVEQGNEALRQSKWDEALAKFDEAVRINPTFGEAYLQRAAAKWKKGLDDGAIADATRAIELGAPPTIAYVNRGCFYVSKGDPSHAIADFNEAIRLSPGDARGYNNRGFAYLMAKNTSKAIDDFSEAIRLDSRFAKAFGNRGSCSCNRACTRGQSRISMCGSALRVATPMRSGCAPKPTFASGIRKKPSRT